MVSNVGLLIIVALAVAGVSGESINVTNSTQDYFLISQRELFHQIEIVDLEVASVDARYSDRLDTIQYEQKKLLLEILQVNRTLMPMQALNLAKKHCIQKYDSQFVSYESAKMQLDVCYNNAVTFGKTLTIDAKSFVSFARGVASNTLPNSVANCDYSYSKNQTALEGCYINAVESATWSVNYYLQQARDKLEKNLYDSIVYSRTATDCTFVVEKNTLETIGVTSKLIDDCYTVMIKENKGSVSQNVKSKMIAALGIESVSRQ